MKEITPDLKVKRQLILNSMDRPISTRLQTFLAVRFSLSILVLLLAALVTGPRALAQTRATAPSTYQLQQEFEQILKSLRNDDSRLDSLVVTNYHGHSIEPARKEALKRSLRAIFGQAFLPAFLAKSAGPVLTSPPNTPQLVAHAIQTTQELRLRGLHRIPPTRQAEFVRFVQGITGSIPPSACRKMFDGTLDAVASSNAERAYMLAMPLNQFQSLVALYEEAFVAELNGWPAVPVLTETQRAQTDTAYSAALEVRMRKMPLEVVASIARGLAQAPAEVACTYHREALAAGLDLGEPYRTWYLTAFIDSLQKPLRL